MLLSLQWPRLASLGDRGPGSNEGIFGSVGEPLAKGSLLPFSVLNDLPQDTGVRGVFARQKPGSHQTHAVLNVTACVFFLPAENTSCCFEGSEIPTVTFPGKRAQAWVS